MGKQKRQARQEKRRDKREARTGHRRGPLVRAIRHTGQAIGDAATATGKALKATGEFLYNNSEGQVSKRNMERQQQFDLAMSNLEWERNLEAWNMSNEYNSPTAQRERLEDAGLNPNLVYQGNAVGNGSGSAPEWHRPQTDMTLKPQIDPIQMMGLYQNFQLRQAQVDNVKARSRQVAADTTNKLLQAGGFGAETRKKIVSADVAELLKYNTIEQATANTDFLNEKVLSEKLRQALTVSTGDSQKLQQAKLKKELEKIATEIEMNKLKNKWQSKENEYHDMGVGGNTNVGMGAKVLLNFWDYMQKFLSP